MANYLLRCYNPEFWVFLLEDQKDFVTMIILGIDPGTQVTGYGIIKIENRLLLPVDYGCIRPPVQHKLSERYLILFNALEELLEKFSPNILAVETQYIHKNAQSAIKLGMARGVAIVAAKRKRLTVYEYAPTKVKSAVVGNGRASKRQVQEMVKCLLNLQQIPKPADAADALALAICHAQANRFKQYFNNEV